MALRFGTYTEFQCPPGRSHAELIWDHIEVGVQADQLGFDVFTCLEHPWFEPFAIMTDPMQLFALMSQRTRNIRFRALCHTLPLHNPMVLAGQIALADILLNGRYEVGLGRGHAWLQQHANIPLAENVERYPECVDILLKAWTEDRFSYEGKFYTCKDLQVVPKPIQKPHPPIWQVGTSSKWVERAVRNGWGVALGGPAPNIAFEEPIRAYHEACASFGVPSNFAYIKAIYLDEDEDKAHEEGREPLVNFIHFNVFPTDSLDRTPEGKQKLIEARYEFYAADDFPNTRNLSYEQLLEYEIVYAGAPDKVADQLVDLLDRFRFDEFLLISDFGGTRRWQSMKTQELFAKRVMPKLQAAYEKMGKKTAVAAA
jgi:alkanesulfonate monooxygenase SsuD/methylene tetrahydromethanopterin reductase-like flavin-dependent oxidoreductase (luciferase family)